jgi:hypothetical protein
MYKNEYQGGSHLSLFGVKERETHDMWEFSENIKRAYDKSLNGYAIILKHNSVMKAPKDRNAQLYLIQPFLVFQVMVLDKRYFSVELILTDMNGIKRRLYFHAGTHIHECASINVQPLHSRIEHDLI